MIASKPVFHRIPGPLGKSVQIAPSAAGSLSLSARPVRLSRCGCTTMSRVTGSGPHQRPALNSSSEMRPRMSPVRSHKAHRRMARPAACWSAHARSSFSGSAVPQVGPMDGLAGHATAGSRTGGGNSCSWITARLSGGLPSCGRACQASQIPGALTRVDPASHCASPH